MIPRNSKPTWSVLLHEQTSLRWSVWQESDGPSRSASRTPSRNAALTSMRSDPFLPGTDTSRSRCLHTHCWVCSKRTPGMILKKTCGFGREASLNSKQVVGSRRHDGPGDTPPSLGPRPLRAGDSGEGAPLVQLQEIPSSRCKILPLQEKMYIKSIL